MAYRLPFNQNQWLPDTEQTLGCLEHAIDERAEKQALLLCDHLREGALIVGANGYLDLTNAIERAYLLSNYQRAQELVADAKAQAGAVADWLFQRETALGQLT